MISLRIMGMRWLLWCCFRRLMCCELSPACPNGTNDVLGRDIHAICTLAFRYSFFCLYTHIIIISLIIIIITTIISLFLFFFLMFFPPYRPLFLLTSLCLPPFPLSLSLSLAPTFSHCLSPSLSLSLSDVRSVSSACCCIFHAVPHTNWSVSSHHRSPRVKLPS